MQKAKGFVVYSLVFLFESGVSFAKECRGGGAYACFGYSPTLVEMQNLQEWKSYREISKGLFGSLRDFDGQSLPKGNLTHLFISISDSTLILDELKNHNAIDVFSPREKKSSLLVDSKNSTLIGSIGLSGVSGEGLEERIAHLTFSGGREIEISSLHAFESSMGNAFARLPSQILETKYQDDQKWALIGSVSNQSHKSATLDFKDGAKMIGDLYAKHSKLSLTFYNHTQPTPSTISLPVVFEGGIHNEGGEIELKLEYGGIRACSILDSYGILTQNDAKTQISFIQQNKSRPQYLFAPQITAHTTSPSASKTENHIIFKNSQGKADNFLSVYDVIADSGKNIISTTGANTELDLFIKRSLLSSHNYGAKAYPQDKIGNTIVIDGNLKVGEYAMRSLEDDGVFGIMTWGGTNTIILKDTSTQDDLENPKIFDRGSRYDAQRTLQTPRIYAGADGGAVGENKIDIDGDLVLMYLENHKDTQRHIIGGEIIATDGGKNTISINGLLEISGYRKRIDETLGVSPNDEIKRDDKELLGTLIGVYGNNPSTQNTLTIKNSDVGGMIQGLGAKDLVLGSIVAYGGKNQISLYSSIHEDFKGVEIKSMIAGDRDLRGRKHAGGINELVVHNGTEVVLKKILTQEGGTNHLYIFQDDRMGNAVQVSELGFVYSGGQTWVYFGNGRDKDSLSSAVKISLEAPNEEKSLVLTTMKNKEGDYEGYGISLSGEFFGEVEHIRGTQAKGAHIEIDYALERDAVFVGGIFSDEVIEQNLLISDNSKFALTNQGNIYLEVLLIDTPTHHQANLFKKTQYLSTTVIDLASGGRSFSNITNRHGARVLDVGNFVIYKNGNYKPLMRFYVPSTHPPQADRIIVQSLKGGGLGLDAQIFLPTSLIGYDFSSDNITIFSTKSGGEDLNISSQMAQTGMVGYRVGLIKESGSKEGEDTPYQWRLGKSEEVIISPDFIRFAGAILAHNYSLFHIHFDSLNQSMGERAGQNSQRVWSKVFGGKQVNDYACAGISSKYLVAQAGYDKSFELEEGENLTGAMLSYGAMDSKSLAFEGRFLFESTYAYRAFSHSAEFGVYNLYFHNSGFYTNTLAKLGYLFTKFNGINDNSVSANLSSLTLSLSQNLGYKIALGKAKEWFITPQAQIALGYLSQSNLEQKYDGQTLQSSLEGVLTLRGGLGGEFGYTLKSSRAKLDFKIGVGYAFDYAYANATYQIKGGTHIQSVKQNSFISPSHRLKLSAGISTKLDDKVDICFDVQKSFFGKINTLYQVSAGIRYSFGDRGNLPLPYNKAKEIYTKLIAQ